MSMTTMDKEMEDQKLSPESGAATEMPVRSLFTRQTGQALITLGTLFKHVPPFSEAIDENTGDTLIAIGRKLKGKK